ncbi:MAG TPA: ATP-binding protein [Candidatus Sulfotelmatobacter sp.]|nr:ATP-binding protein [Candidatus Sulfotelmatobacter sp.]
MSSTGKANAVLAAAIIFLLLSSCAAYLAIKRLQTSGQWVVHTLDVQHALDHFSSTVGRAGRLRAEYLQTGDAALISRQAEVVVEVRNSLADIQKLTADNVNQQVNWKKLAAITEQRLTFADQALQRKRSGIQAPINQEMMAAADASDALIQNMANEEERLLSERQQRQRSSFTVIGAILLTSLFLALVLFLVHHEMITDQVRERLRAETAQRNLSARLLTLQDEERRKFARELHDSVGQHLAAIKMAVSMLEKKLPSDPIVNDCLKLADDAIAETRTISHLLHPPLLDEAGLNSAIQWFVDGFARRSGIQVNLQIQPGVQRFEDSTELVLFRALQESLTNVHRHSGAKQADVSLTTSGDEVVLTVRDHGDGMPAAVLQNLKEERAAGGVGLAGMTERIREIGGRLEVNSSVHGTEISARVPVRSRVAPNGESLPAPVFKG